MNKKLKIQFWKAEKTLAMQILEQEGLPSYKEEGFALICDQPALCEYSIDLRGRAKYANLLIPCVEFATNTERDAYLDKVIDAITDELFTVEGELNIGEMCEVSDDGVSWRKYRLLAILPDRYEMRFIIENGTLSWCTCTYARPIVKRIEPTIEERGQLITCTWEEK
jgi:hypothetical protein